MSISIIIINCVGLFSMGIGISLTWLNSIGVFRLPSSTKSNNYSDYYTEGKVQASRTVIQTTVNCEVCLLFHVTWIVSFQRSWCMRSWHHKRFTDFWGCSGISFYCYVFYECKTRHLKTFISLFPKYPNLIGWGVLESFHSRLFAQSY